MANRWGRRTFVAALGVAAVGWAAAGPAAASEYADVVNVVDEGADDTGGESITPVLYRCRRKYGDDTLLTFPDGTYFMDAQFRFTGFTRFGLTGPGATIVPADYYGFDGPQYRLFRLGTNDDPGRNLQFEGFTVDQTAKDTGIRVLETVVHDGLAVSDITVTGFHDSGTWGPARFCVTDPGGSGTVTRFKAPDGGEKSVNAPGDLDRGPTGILISRSHRGTIELRDCVLGGFPDNGLYGTSDGTIRVVGGHYENSDTASIRLRGYDCLVKDATVTVDANPQGFANQRGIRLDAGTGFRLSNVTIDLAKPNGHAVTLMDHVGRTRIEDSAITVGDRVNHGIVVESGANATAIVDTDVKLAGGGNAVHIEDGDGAVVCERMIISGMASGATFRHAIRCNRDGCEFRGLEIWQPGPHKRRAIVFNGDDCLLYDSLCKVRQIPVLVNGTGAWIEANDLESYDDWPAIKLADTSADVTIKDNTLKNGVLNDGSSGLRMYGNDVI